MYSLTQKGNLASLAGALVIILQLFGIDIPAEDVMTILAAVAIIAGPIVSWIGRYRVGDITAGGFRK
jgi:hypothetical protein